MEPISFAAIGIILANVIISYKGFSDISFMETYAFNVDEILIHKDYKRLISSGFLHVSWTHLIFNMVTLYAFSSSLEVYIGVKSFLIIYFTSLLGGDLFSLFIHRNHGDYTSVGASGAISGIVFSSIALFPGMEIGFLSLQVHIPAWLYAGLYTLISIYGIKSQRDNIGHDAHLGGGLVGLVITLLLYPKMISLNYLPVLMIIVPASIFIYLLIAKPEFMLLNRTSGQSKGFKTIEDKYNADKLRRERELDQLLEKISKTGFESLSAEEKLKLDKYSQ